MAVDGLGCCVHASGCIQACVSFGGTIQVLGTGFEERGQKGVFRHRESNPGLLGESQLS